MRQQPQLGAPLRAVPLWLVLARRSSDELGTSRTPLARARLGLGDSRPGCFSRHLPGVIAGVAIGPRSIGYVPGQVPGPSSSTESPTPRRRACCPRPSGAPIKDMIRKRCHGRADQTYPLMPVRTRQERSPWFEGSGRPIACMTDWWVVSTTKTPLRAPPQVVTERSSSQQATSPQAAFGDGDAVAMWLHGG